MMTLAHQTRIAVHIVLDDDTGNVANLIAALTILIGMLISFGQFMADVILSINEVIENMSFIAKVFVITSKAWLYGLGVPI
jgi:hypothetical protein